MNLTKKYFVEIKLNKLILFGEKFKKLHITNIK